MACFNAFPIEILRNIIENIPERPFKTELLLLNKTLCSIFMTEQIRILTLDHFQLKSFIEIIKDNDIQGLYSVPQYHNLLNSIHEINTSPNDQKFFMKKEAGFIHRCKNLRRLAVELRRSLLYNAFTPSDISDFFNDLPLSVVEIEFKSTTFYKDAVQSLFRYVKRSKKLAKLCFRDNFLDREDNRILAECLKQKHTVLTDLDLSHNRMGADSVCALAEGLKENTTLIDLNLYNNEIGTKGACALARCLKQNTALTSLNLGYAFIDVEGFCALAECIKLNTTLINMTIGDSGVSTEGVCALAEGLKLNTTLGYLNLRDNGIGFEGGCALAESLKLNTTLTNLDLLNNRINDKGACALAEGLKLNTALINLNLSFNDIGNKGAYSLAESMKENSTLIRLNLFGNKIENKGAYALTEGLQQNKTLTELYLGSNSITNQENIIKSLKPNTILTIYF